MTFRLVRTDTYAEEWPRCALMESRQTDLTLIRNGAQRNVSKGCNAHRA